jgi:hypothetical protein
VKVVNINGTLHTHAKGCRDLAQTKYRGHIGDAWEVNADIQKVVVEDTYGPPSSFYEESGFAEDDPNAWRSFSGDFKFYPCVNLPEV